MNENEYSVIVDDVKIACEMTLGNALILVEALFQKWHNEVDMRISIQREDNRVRCIAEECKE